MNTRPAITESAGPIALFATFNQDASCFAVGLDTGFCVFDSDPCNLKVSRDFNAGIGAVEMIGRANYVGLVGGGRQPKYAQNKVIIWDDNKQQAIFTLEFNSPVNRVRLSRSHIIVALQNSVHCYGFTSPPGHIASFETADNPRGLVCLSEKHVIFPGRTPGQVQLVETATGNVSIIPAHSSALKALELSLDGEILATASGAGTLIRTFSTGNCVRTAELRRGVDHADIYSIAISPSSQFLAVTSDKGTLHVFELPRAHTQSEDGPATTRPRGNSELSTTSSNEEGLHQKWGVLGKLPLMPRVFSDVYSMASSHFVTLDDPPSSMKPGVPVPIPGLPGGKARKGIIGWKDETTLLVIGAGRNTMWERFHLRGPEHGQKRLIRTGWRRYLGS